MVMSALVVDDIGLLVTNSPELGAGPLGLVPDAALVVDGGEVVALERAGVAGDERISADGRCVIPGFVDSHTHLVFAGDRAAEFAARMSGRPYEAGGIRVTTEATRRAGDAELRDLTTRRRAEALRAGITHIEIKSGYGLDPETERRLCAIAAEFTDDVTFLGAHVVPVEYEGRPDDYVELVCGEMLAACAPHAKWIDVFCERGAFDADQARAVLAAGAAVGLKGRLHANQLGPGPGVALAAELGLTAVDHCTYLDDADVDALRDAGTVATLLPGVEFSTRQPYPDARRLLDAGVRVALASDCNPGSCFTSSIPLCIALAVREMGMTPAEAVHAVTRRGADALGRDDIGALVPGGRADLVMLDAPTHVHLAYRPGVPLVTGVWRAGRPT